jgi:hypothetical protein
LGPQKETDGTYKDVIEESVMKGLCITLWTGLKGNYHGPVKHPWVCNSGEENTTCSLKDKGKKDS